MKKQHFTTSFTVDQTPDEVFKAVNNVRGWWSGQVNGESDRLHAEFIYKYKNVHTSTQRVTEFTPGKKIMSARVLFGTISAGFERPTQLRLSQPSVP
jgi:hypothetical protein